RRGARAPMSDPITQLLSEAVTRVVPKTWGAAKRRADRENRLRASDHSRLRAPRVRKTSIKEAAFEVMEGAYLHVSGGTLPAHARQIMYAARPGVLRLTGGECWSHSSYFTQTLLPEYEELHPEKTADWDVVYDARGHLTEPHTAIWTPLGTIDVRDYIGKFGDADDEAVRLKHAFPTYGPAQRYR